MLGAMSIAPEDVDALLALLAGRRFVALTGAGCSTESGIPDYRGEGRTGPRNPIMHAAFIREADVRRRYWARATLGWERFRGARPNAAHQALAALEAAGLLAGVITQNVDRLHQRAGSRRVVELHGALADVHCLACGGYEPRADVQRRLLDANPDWLARVGAELRPDGDAELSPALVTGFEVVDCQRCGGPLMPQVVFFGGSVSAPTLTAAWDLLAAGQSLMVVGSSLTVYSGFRFVRHAHEVGQSIAIVNLGPTRGDALATVRVSARVGALLPRLAAALGAPVDEAA
jgi:NAD-dependent deacetylase sirtuin 4